MDVTSTNKYFTDRQNEFESSARSYPRKFPFALKKAKGVWVEDVEGNKYLDFLCGAGTLALGHNDDEVNQAMMKNPCSNSSKLFGCIFLIIGFEVDEFNTCNIVFLIAVDKGIIYAF